MKVGDETGLKQTGVAFEQVFITRDKIHRMITGNVINNQFPLVPCLNN
jgi:hypothetical protein